MNPLYIAIFAGLSITMFVLFIGGVITDHSRRAKLDNEEDGIYENITERLFYALFPDKTPEEVASEFGIDPEDYYKSCRIVKIEPDLIHLTMHTLYGTVIGLSFFLIGLITNIGISLTGIVLMFYIGYLPRTRLKTIANKYRAEVADELPGFLGLLKTELAIGIPIENAINLITSRQNTRLAYELQLVSRKAELGSASWVGALEEMASDYNVETFKTFVLSVSSAYSKGVSIADTVTRASEDIQKTHMLAIEKEASHITSIIILPVIVLQIMPVMAFMLVPVIISLRSMNF